MKGKCPLCGVGTVDEVDFSQYNADIILNFLKDIQKECTPHGKWVYDYTKKKLHRDMEAYKWMTGGK